MHAPIGQARALLISLLDRADPRQAEALVVAGQLCDALEDADREVERLSATVSQQQRKWFRRTGAEQSLSGQGSVA
jgi:UDP-2,3-diacylglucosamine pyrophosphatase LpxH